MSAVPASPRQPESASELRPWLRAAFAVGYAECDSPAIFPVLRASTAAMEDALGFAEAHVARDGLIEWLRREGRIAAIRQTVQIRREGLERKWQLRMLPFVRQAAQRIAPIVARRLRPREQNDGEDAASQALDGLRDDPIWAEWAAAVRDAEIEALAEGRVDALHYLAALRGQPMQSWDLAFPAAVDALKQINPASRAQSWIEQFTHGMAYDVGQATSAALAQGASFDDLVTLIQNVAAADDGSAMLMTGHMIATGTSEGSLDLYGSEGVEMVNLLISPTACDECVTLEASSPMPLDEAEGEVPVHPNCRCGWEPVL